MARRWRWLVVLVGVGVLLATPSLVGALPGRAPPYGPVTCSRGSTARPARRTRGTRRPPARSPCRSLASSTPWPGCSVARRSCGCGGAARATGGSTASRPPARPASTAPGRRCGRGTTRATAPRSSRACWTRARACRWPPTCCLRGWPAACSPTRRSAEVTSLPSRRIAGRDTQGLRLRPADRRTTVDHVDVWADAASAIPLRVDVVGARSTPRRCPRSSPTSAPPSRPRR